MADKTEETNSSSFLLDLPRVEWRPNWPPMFLYKGFWLYDYLIKSLPNIETQYNPLPTDVLIASFPKCGTTWLKAITLSILHNNTLDDPLQTKNPHQLVSSFEDDLFKENPRKKIDDIPFPRIFSTHLPYSILPEKVKRESTGCKIIYISRNPADVIVSGWNFFMVERGMQKTLQEYFDEFIQGITFRGPYFDHVLEYWEERKRENILFITYEGLHKYPNKTVKMIADFLGCSFSDDKIEQIVNKTSFDHLSKLDINTNKDKGVTVTGGGFVPFKSFFRKGNVGDGKKCFTRDMLKRLDAITYEKWGGLVLELEP